MSTATTMNGRIQFTHIESCPSSLELSVVISIPSTYYLEDPRTSFDSYATTNESITPETSPKTFLKRFWAKFKQWHFARWQPRISRSTIVFRCLSIILGLLLMIQFAVVNANKVDRSPSFIIQFMYGAEYPLYEITAIVYASGTAALGISFELYFSLIFAVINVIFASVYCDELTVNIIYVIKVTFLHAATELIYQNYRLLPQYKQAFDQSARYTLHQALLFSATMLFLVARGLRAVYLGATGTCAYHRDACGFNDLYRPQFNASDLCENTFVDYLSGREELRVLRNWVLLNIAFHAIFNRALFDFSGTGYVRWPLPRFVLRILFIALATSFIAVNIWPFEYHNFKLAFDIVECVLFILTIGLMIYNLMPCARQNTRKGQEEEPMQRRPTILPNH
jgi:hypothetical protein